MAPPVTAPIPERRPRGRPTPAATAARNRDLLDVAAELFHRNGFAGTSVNEVARLTGISKTTIYARYRDKADLFRAICSYACRVPSDALRAVEVTGRDPYAVLSDYADAARASMLSEDALDLLRLTIFEAKRFPEIAAVILEESRRTYAPLTDYLGTLADNGTITGNPVILADHFIALVTGGFRPLLASTADDPEQDGQKPALALFLAGIGL